MLCGGAPPPMEHSMAPAPPHNVSGASVHAMREFLEQRLGQDGMERLRQALPPALTAEYVVSPMPFTDLLPEQGLMELLHQASTQTGTSVLDLMFELGRFMLPFIVKHAGYERCIRRVSPTLLGFARCLTQQLLAQMFLALTDRSPPMPEARIADVAAGSFTLSMFAPRTGDGMRIRGALTLFKGMLHWAAEELYSLHLTYADLGVTTLPTGQQTQSIKVCVQQPSPSNFTMCTSAAQDRRHASPKNIMGLDPDTFAKLFPFHFSVDLDFRVLQAGEALCQMLPRLSQPGTHIGEVLKVRVPDVPWSMDCLQGILESDMTKRVVLSSKGDLGLELHGGLHRVWQMQSVECGWLASGREALMFLGNPSINSIEDMERLNLFLSDFPPQDTAPEQVLFSASKQVQAENWMQEVAQDNNALKETLAETLACQQEEAGRKNLSFDCAGHVMLRLLDGLVLGEEVTAQQVLAARAALLRSGDSVWKPIDFGSRSLVEDKEVNASLAKMLGTQAGQWSAEENAKRQETELEISSPSNAVNNLMALCTPSLIAGHSRTAGPQSFTHVGSASMGRRGVRRNTSQSDLTSRRAAAAAVAAQLQLQALTASRSSVGSPEDSRPPTKPQLEDGLLVTGVSDSGVQGSDEAASSMKRWLKESVSKVFKPFRSHTSRDSPGSGSSTPAASNSHNRAQAVKSLDVDPKSKELLPKLGKRVSVADHWPLNHTINLPSTPSEQLASVELEQSSRDHLQRLSTLAVVQRAVELESSDNEMLSGKLLGAAPTTDTLSIRMLQQPSEEVVAALSSINEWQFDSLALDRATNGRPLSFLAFHLMQRTGVIRQLQLDEHKLSRFLMRIEDGYGSNPYHNRIHASDVLRSFHVILTRGGILQGIAKHQSEAASASHGAGELQGLIVTGHENPESDSLQLLTCYLAAIVHDYEHRGVNNDFLIKSTDPLALRYNDISPMENHHLAAAFTLMQDKQYSFLPASSKKTRAQMRKTVVDLVLATDMKQHFALTSSFAHKVATTQPRREAQPAGDLQMRLQGLPRPSMSHSLHSRVPLSSIQLPNFTVSADKLDKVFTSWDADTELLVLKMALKAADLGHLTSSVDVHKQWVARLEEELFLQGDRERALGQPISPLMDRTKAGIQKSQTGFFKVVALPMYQGFAQAFPKCSVLLTSLERNAEYWRGVEAEAAAPSGGAK